MRKKDNQNYKGESLLVPCSSVFGEKRTRSATLHSVQQRTRGAIFCIRKRRRGAIFCIESVVHVLWTNNQYG